MTSQNEQERLVAATLAVVQRLAEGAAAPAASVSYPVATHPAKLPRYMNEMDLRKEMQARLETFRNRQRFLEIEREAHYQHAMQRIRSATEQYAKP